ncbi:MAG: RsbRD N-terminal domain-containing protein [Deltaproteobacteria bacterium]|nr:RsbRD N-terminal domain-containing protein [Deltaproteobacteria bacterium]
MNLAAVLEQSCTSLARKWTDAANALYPLAAEGFLRSSRDPFANPLGRRSADLAPLLFRAAVGLPHDEAALRSALEEFARVRAMQDAPPETSLAVLFAYKNLVRNHLKELGYGLTAADREELDALDARCDALALLAFGLYSRARDAFFEARLRDARRRHSQILRLAERHGFADTPTEPGGDASAKPFRVCAEKSE